MLRQLLLPIILITTIILGSAFGEQETATTDYLGVQKLSFKRAEYSIDWAAGKEIDLAEQQTPKAFRLLDCKAYREDRIIRVWEWESLDITTSGLKYATISYVWKGIHKSPIPDSFAVKGVEDGDRINIGVLRTACSEAVGRGMQYMWLDQLCIMQTSKEDTNWQVMNMGEIYKRSTACFILPGGIGGLVEVGETTSWINRAWTLQEAVFSKSAYCIIKWTHGNGYLIYDLFGLMLDYTVIPDGETLTMELRTIFLFTFEVAPKFMPGSNWEERDLSQAQSISFSKLLSYAYEPQLALKSMLVPDWRGDAPREFSIWQSALTRAASKDIDAVYSIMGLFGVKLDPSRYTNRSEALIALLQELMRRGKEATWLAASMVSPGVIPNLPIPANSDERRVLIRERDGNLIDAHKVVRGIDWYLSGAPTGTMNDSSISFTVPFSSVKLTQVKGGGAYNGFTHEAVVETPGGTLVNAILGGGLGDYAVVLGYMAQHQKIMSPPYDFAHDTLLMLLEPIEGQAWRKTGMAAVPETFTRGWKQSEVTIML